MDCAVGRTRDNLAGRPALPLHVRSAPAGALPRPEYSVGHCVLGLNLANITFECVHEASFPGEMRIWQ